MARQRDLSELHRQESAEDAPYRNAKLSNWKPFQQGERMKDVEDGLREVGKRLARIAQTIIEALDKMTPEQRMIVEFLAENPKVAEAFQELNQKLEKQKVIGGAILDGDTEVTNTEPKEPLIKDEKIRKAVRAWAEANDYGKDEEYQYEDFSTGWKSWSLEHHQNGDDNEIHFNGGIDFRKMNHQGYYTIAELCGEEEE